MTIFYSAINIYYFPAGLLITVETCLPDLVIFTIIWLVFLPFLVMNPFSLIVTVFYAWFIAGGVNVFTRAIITIGWFI